MVRNSNTDNFDTSNNNNDNNNSDSGNSEEIETNNNIAFKRMKITSETDQDINFTQSSVMDRDNSSSNPSIENGESQNNLIGYNPVNSEM